MPGGSNDIRVVGRYALCDRIAGGGMATVHLGRLLGQAGFSRTVAIKRLHANLAGDPEFVSMFIDEARLAARVHHPNVVSTLDVVARGGELFLVMEYVHGESVAKLVRAAAERGVRTPPRVAAAIAAGFLHGLHAAHEARSERGEPLNIVHRDISPQNIIVGVDGVPRVVDFGVAKAVGRVQTTRDGQIKGKLAYMAPEQISGTAVTRGTDIYAASVVLWELLTGKRLVNGDNDGAVVAAVLLGAPPEPPSSLAPVPVSIDRVVLRGLSRQPEARFQSARDMALAIEQAMDVAMPSEVGAWVQSMAAEALSVRAALVGTIESRPRTDPPSGHSQVRIPDERVPATPASENVSTTEPPTLLTSSKEDEVRPRSYRVTVSLGIAAGIAVAAVVFYARASVHAHAATKAAPRAAATVAPQPSAAPLPATPPASESATAVATRAPAEPTPQAIPSVASNAPVRTPRVHAQASPAAPKRPSPTSNCDPPYRIDPSGRKIFKMECL